MMHFIDQHFAPELPDIAWLPDPAEDLSPQQRGLLARIAQRPLYVAESLHRYHGNAEDLIELVGAGYLEVERAGGFWRYNRTLKYA